MAQEASGLRRCPSMSDLDAQFDNWHLHPDEDDTAVAMDLGGSALQRLATVPDPMGFVAAALGSLSDDGQVFDWMNNGGREARWRLHDAPVEVVACEPRPRTKNGLDLAVRLGKLHGSASGAFR